MVQNPQSEKHWAQEHHRNWSVLCRIVRLETPGAETVESRGRMLRGISFSLACPQASIPPWPKPSKRGPHLLLSLSPAQSTQTGRQPGAESWALGSSSHREEQWTESWYSQNTCTRTRLKFQPWKLQVTENKTKTHQLCDRLKKRLMAKAPVISENPAPTHPTSSWRESMRLHFTGGSRS